MHINVLEVFTSRPFIGLGAKAGKSLVCQKRCNLAIFGSAHHNVNSKVEFKTVYQHRIANVPLHYHFFGCEGWNLPQILEEYNVFALIASLRLRNKCCILIIFLVFMK